jgi:glucose/arabinose dehydrogenase
MHRRLTLLVTALALAAGIAPGVGDASTLVSIGAGLRGPSGLRATVYATGLTHVSAFAFDATGRLWVTTSAATDHSADGVYLIRAAGARPVKVISGLQGPLGLVWRTGTLYVDSIGRVDAYRGLKGTRFATHRTILTEPAGHGWNQDLVLAPNGRLIMSIASACDHCTMTSRYSASIVSFDPSGTNVTTYVSRIRAVFGLAFYPGTSTLLASMNQRDDLGTKTPGDALAIVRAGQDWRFPGCYDQGGSACSGVPAVLATLDAHAAAGGVAIATGQLGSAIGTAALVPEWELGKVLGVSLARHGSALTAGTPTTVLTGFKSPLPVTLSAGKALLVGDWTTGTIYRIAASS